MAPRASHAVHQQAPAPLRYLPNGMAMKEVEPHEDDGKDYTLGKIYGTRLTGDRRYYLVKFDGYDVLYWLAASCCSGSRAPVEHFKKSMGWTHMPKVKGEEFVLPECLKASTENAPKAAPAAKPGPSTRTTRKRKAKSVPRPVKRRSLGSTETSGPSSADIDGPAQPTAGEPSICDGPKEAPACDVTIVSQLLPAMNIAPYAEAFKRGLVPGVRRDIVVSLEEAYAGCMRRMAITCEEFDHSIDIRVNPGTLAGHRWTYPLPDGNTVTFTLKDAPRTRFHREGSDIIYTHRLPLREALLGARFNVELFTGEVVKLEFDGPVFNDMKKRIAGYGMPLPTKPWKRGDLVLEFDVEFPDAVSDEFHEGIMKLL
ncbi:dnaJ subfamily B member 4 [Aphelenchoides avenae]|nr:dnaJ subfamily B member 4 [Aphelenchus avenae]